MWMHKKKIVHTEIKIKRKIFKKWIVKIHEPSLI